MSIFRIFSTLFCLSLVVFCLNNAYAQDRFGTDEMARSSDIYGYSQYNRNIRNNGIKNSVRHEYVASPIVRPMGNYNNSVLGFSGDLNNPDSLLSRYEDRNNGKNNDVSEIEKFYRKKTGDITLGQWGYDLFQVKRRSQESQSQDVDGGRDDFLVAPAGIAQDSYIVQIGDELTVIFDGERKDREAYIVDTNGRFFIKNFPVITAAGKSLKDLEREVNNLVSGYGYYGNVTLSLSGMRQINVLVAGQVVEPGRYMMNAFGSVMDAVRAAGGIRKSGSLRKLKLIRNGNVQYIDLYSFFNSKNIPLNIDLQDGDKIIVPLLGPTVAITGDVKQVGIFELRSDPRLNWRKPNEAQSEKISVMQALQLAGGVLSAGQNSLSLTDAQSRIRNVDNRIAAMMMDGSVLNVTRAKDRLDNAVRLAGYSRQNGVYDVSDTSTLGALLNDRDVFDMDVYPLIGLIVSMNSKTLTRDIAGFVPQLVAKNGSGKKLRGGDTVYLFSYDDIAQIIEDDPISNTSENLNLDNNKDINADLNYPRLVRNFVRDNVVTINGAVWDVGAWPIGGHVSVMDVLLAAGGVTQKANPDKVEVVTTDKSGYSSRSIISEKALFETRVRAGDQVRVPEQFKQTIASAVRITGEVINPGTYDLMRGDTLLSVLERAGGVTDQAFPAGAVFSRKSERKREEQKFRAAAQNLQKTISMNLNGDDSRLSNDQVILAQGLINDLRDAKALGRITVEADPAVLIARPELNLLVENGDRIHIPKRPMNVRVSGEVMNPASLLFEENKDVDDYLAEAGGVTYYADKGRRFVVYPDGSAQPVGGWNDKLAMIIPGSTIVVPRDPKPFDFMESFKDITQILTNMAITGVFIEDIATDEN